MVGFTAEFAVAEIYQRPDQYSSSQLEASAREPITMSVTKIMLSTLAAIVDSENLTIYSDSTASKLVRDTISIPKK